MLDSTSARSEYISVYPSDYAPLEHELEKCCIVFNIHVLKRQREWFARPTPQM